jgi:hypothetical protein
MPESRWINPIFYVGAFISFVVALFLLTLFTLLPNWAELLIAYIFGAIGGIIFVRIYFHYYPDAIYLTKDKINGFGYVWGYAEVLMPYIILGILFLLCSTVSSLISYFK